MDETTGQFGRIEGQADQRQAQSEAMKRCARRGSPNCRVEIDYHNQCGAVAYYTGAGGAEFSRAPTREKAERLAMGECTKNFTGNGKCEVVYSGCSYAERVQ